MTEPPVVVEVCRGGRVESRHAVALCVCDAAATVRLALGDAAMTVYPRSAVKPFQAIPLVESGAADAAGLDVAELALSCASHSGTPEHVARVGIWLQRIGRHESDLACAPHDPLDIVSARALWRSGDPPCRLHNNCSGKHTGMLTLARFRGLDPASYVDPHHPLQREILAAVSDVTGADAADAPAVDGCGAPAPAMPLSALATGAARIADPPRPAPARAEAIRRIGAAMRARPDLVSGPGREDLTIMSAVPDVVSKTGAEGVFMAALPTLGLGLAIKALDGAGRASETALVAVLDALGLTRQADPALLEPWRRPILRNHTGDAVGEIRIEPASTERLDRLARSLR